MLLNPVHQLNHVIFAVVKISPVPYHIPPFMFQNRRIMPAYISHGTRIRHCCYLFAVGVAFALVLNLLQRQRKVTIFPPGIFGDVLNSAWWVPLACGLAASEYQHSDIFCWQIIKLLVVVSHLPPITVISSVQLQLLPAIVKLTAGPLLA